jgi:hypothetical protein
MATSATVTTTSVQMDEHHLRKKLSYPHLHDMEYRPQFATSFNGSKE